MFVTEIGIRWKFMLFNINKPLFFSLKQRLRQSTSRNMCFLSTCCLTFLISFLFPSLLVFPTLCRYIFFFGVILSYISILRELVQHTVISFEKKEKSLSWSCSHVWRCLVHAPLQTQEIIRLVRRSNAFCLSLAYTVSPGQPGAFTLH